MAYRWQVLMSAAISVFLLGCDRPMPKEKIELLDAFAFAVDGIENNSTDDVSTNIPRTRRVSNKSIEYFAVGNNGISFSDKETNEKIRSSHFVRYMERVSSPTPCVFEIETDTEFSIGDSKEDFSSLGGPGKTVINLSEAHTFELNYNSDYNVGNLVIEGPAVICSSACSNSLVKELWNLRSDIANRRVKAIEFIKKACPGKSY